MRMNGITNNDIDQGILPILDQMGGGDSIVGFLDSLNSLRMPYHLSAVEDNVMLSRFGDQLAAGIWPGFASKGLR